MAYVFQVVLDGPDPHNQADWWAEALGWQVEGQDEAFIRRMIEAGLSREVISPAAHLLPPKSAFAGFRFPPEVIAVAIRWYLRFNLSYRDVEELLLERGVEVDHVTVYRWVQRFTPLLADAARFARHSPGERWFVDETYVKVTACGGPPQWTSGPAHLGDDGRPWDNEFCVSQ